MLDEKQQNKVRQNNLALAFLGAVLGVQISCAPVFEVSTPHAIGSDDVYLAADAMVPPVLKERCEYYSEIAAKSAAKAEASGTDASARDYWRQRSARASALRHLYAQLLSIAEAPRLGQDDDSKREVMSKIQEHYWLTLGMLRGMGAEASVSTGTGDLVDRVADPVSTSAPVENRGPLEGNEKNTDEEGAKKLLDEAKRKLTPPADYAAAWFALDELMRKYPASGPASEVQGVRDEIELQETRAIKEALPGISNLYRVEKKYDDALKSLAELEKNFPHGGYRAKIGEMRAMIHKLKGDYTAGQDAGAPAASGDGAANQGGHASEIRRLITQRKYEEAIGVAGGLRGPEITGEIKRLRIQAVDEFVGAQREAAAKLFMESKKTADKKRRTQMLTEAQKMLSDVVEKFPESAYHERAKGNLDVVIRELNSIGQ